MEAKNEKGIKCCNSGGYGNSDADCLRICRQYGSRKHGVREDRS
jgi:hypothetical protein